MTNREIAAQIFTARGKKILDLDFRGIGNETEINARYSFRHGWIVVNGESFNMELAFLNERFPRFSADQRVSD